MGEGIERIGGVDKAAKAAKAMESMEEFQPLPPNKEKFDQLLGVDQSAKIQPDIKIEPGQQTNVFELSSQTENMKIEPAQVVTATEKAIDKIDTVKTQLTQLIEKAQSEGLTIKDSARAKMENSLTHINDNIRIAVEKVGGEFPVGPSAQTAQAGPSSNPIHRFLGMLTDGQNELQNMSEKIAKMHSNKQEISPTAMLSMQIKVGQVTQQLEFFSNMLNQGLTSIKTLFNVQV